MRSAEARLRARWRTPAWRTGRGVWRAWAWAVAAERKTYSDGRRAVMGSLPAFEGADELVERRRRDVAHRGQPHVVDPARERVRRTDHRQAFAAMALRLERFDEQRHVRD